MKEIDYNTTHVFGGCDGFEVYSSTTVKIIENNGNPIGKVVKRYYRVCGKYENRNDFVIGTPSQVNKLFAKYGRTFDCKRADEYAVCYAISKYTKELFTAKVDSFLTDFKTLLDKYEMKVKLVNDGAGCCDSYITSYLELYDTKLDSTYHIIENYKFDNEEEFK